MQPNPFERPIGAGLLTVSELKSMIAKLPAEGRSAIAWSVPAIEAALERLRTEPLDDQLIDECSLEVGRAGASVAKAMSSVLTAGELAHAGDAFVEQRSRLLRSSLPPEAAQTAEWALRLFMSMLQVLRVASTLMPANGGSSPAIAEDVWLRASRAPVAGSFVRLQTLLHAVLHAVDPSRHVGEAALARTEALVDLASEHAVTVMNHATALGLKLAVFDEQPAHLRIRLFQKLAKHLRSMLSDEDRQVLADARLRDLR